MMYSIIKTQNARFGDISGKTHFLQLKNTNKNKTASGEIVITELCHTNSLHCTENRPALIFVPGMFTSRKFWLSNSGIGLAAYLFDKGFNCFLIDRRGIGQSTKSQPNINYTNFWQHDLPALQHFVIQRGFANAFWIGHSFGGVAFTLSLAKHYLKQNAIAGLVTFSSQLTIGKKALNPPVSWLSYPLIKLLGYLPAKLAGLGPENESAQTIFDLYNLVSWAKGRKTKHDKPFWHGFDTIDVPTLSFASVGDTVDPFKGCKIYHNALGSRHKQFILLEKSSGHIMNYTHAGMVISKPAQEEIWPKLEAWLQTQIVQMVEDKKCL